MSYQEQLRQHRRLTILRTLSEAQGFATNESVLHDLVTAYGFRDSRDTIRGDLAWLGEQGLVELSEPGGLMIAELTERGGDVAAGRASQPGVAKPSPKR
mgnify:CR=1 FL=1